MNAELAAGDIVDAQGRAYNARDIEAYCALYAPDAVISTLNDGTEHAKGIDAIRAYFTHRFQSSPNLHCEVRGRMKIGDFVIDYEHVTGIGDENIQLIAVYEVRDSLIRSLHFIRK